MSVGGRGKSACANGGHVITARPRNGLFAAFASCRFPIHPERIAGSGAERKEKASCHRGSPRPDYLAASITFSETTFAPASRTADNGSLSPAKMRTAHARQDRLSQSRLRSFLQHHR